MPSSCPARLTIACSKLVQIEAADQTQGGGVEGSQVFVLPLQRFFYLFALGDIDDEAADAVAVRDKVQTPAGTRCCRSSPRAGRPAAVLAKQFHEGRQLGQQRGLQSEWQTIPGTAAVAAGFI